MAPDTLTLIVLSASQYNFEDPSDHRKVNGTSVLVVSPETSATENRIGNRPSKITFPFDFFDRFRGTQLPAFADVTFKLDIGTMKSIPTDFNNFRPISVPPVK